MHCVLTPVEQMSFFMAMSFSDANRPNEAFGAAVFPCLNTRHKANKGSELWTSKNDCRMGEEWPFHLLIYIVPFSILLAEWWFTLDISLNLSFSPKCQKWFLSKTHVYIIHPTFCFVNPACLWKKIPTLLARALGVSGTSKPLAIKAQSSAAQHAANLKTWIQENGWIWGWSICNKENSFHHIYIIIYIYLYIYNYIYIIHLIEIYRCV